MDYFFVGDKIREYREKNGLSQDELAELASIHRVTLARYEAGKIDPGSQALARIADALGVSMDVLAGRSSTEDDPTKQPPRTPEARIVSTGMDRMPKDKRETLLSVILAMYQKDHPEYFTQEGSAPHDAGL